MKDKRLEIRVSSEDKDVLKRFAKLSGCTITSLIQEHIDNLIEMVKDKLPQSDDN